MLKNGASGHRRRQVFLRLDTACSSCLLVSRPTKKDPTHPSGATSSLLLTSNLLRENRTSRQILLIRMNTILSPLRTLHRGLVDLLFLGLTRHGARPNLVFNGLMRRPCRSLGAQILFHTSPLLIQTLTATYRVAQPPADSRVPQVSLLRPGFPPPNHRALHKANSSNLIAQGS